MPPKSFILFFDTNKVTRLVKKKIQDGMAEVEGKLFWVDESNPLLMKTRGGYSPLYIIKWSNIKPSTNLNEFKPTEQVTPEFKDKLSGEMTPEMFRKLTGLKILGNMIKTKAKTEIGGFVMLFVGLILGIVILWSLSYLKLIPVL